MLTGNSNDSSRDDSPELPPDSRAPAPNAKVDGGEGGQRNSDGASLPDQAELDALIAECEKEERELTPAYDPRGEEPLTGEVDPDETLTGKPLPAEPSEEAPARAAPTEEETLVSESGLDALIDTEQKETPEDNLPSGEPRAPAEAPTNGDAAQTPSAGEPGSNEESEPQATETEPEQAVGLDQEEIDALDRLATLDRSEAQGPETEHGAEVADAGPPREAVSEASQELARAEAGSEPPESTPPERESTALSAEELLDEANIDSLLTELDVDQPLDSQTVDRELRRVAAKPKASPPSPSEVEGGDAQESPAGQPAADEASADQVTQDMVAALIASEADEDEETDRELVGTENLAAAAPASASEEGLLSEVDLDALIQEANGTKEEKPEATRPGAVEPAVEFDEALEEIPDQEEEPKEEPKEEPTVPKKVREPTRAGIYIQQNSLKIFVSLMAMIVGTLGAFAFLYTHQERLPDAESLTALQTVDLSGAMAAAERRIEAGAYQQAVAELDRALTHAPSTPERTDAEFLRLKARYMRLTPTASELEVELVEDAISAFVEHAPTHPRVVDVLRWKAQLYQRDNIPHAAQSIYRHIVASYPNAPHLDEVLMEGAKLATALAQPREASDYLERLLEDYPGSRWASEAKLMLADTYAAAGETDKARRLYERIAQTQPGTRRGAEACAHLAKLALDRGTPAEAIQLLERRLLTATTIEGNEQIYLFLARAYRANGRLEDARRTLNDLIDFFPENAAHPEAFIELSHVLDAMGKRKEALRLAQQAAQRYPEDPAVLKSSAIFLDLTGDPLQAADAMLNANKAGANDPEVLLGAARCYSKGEAWREARETYEQLVREFPTSPQAFEGTIEQAEVMYRSGQVRKAIRKLEDLALASEGQPTRLPILMALGSMYQDLGLRERVAEIFGEVASSSSEPEVLGEAAVALLDAELLDQGLAVAKRVDIARVGSKTAYGLLTKRGEVLLRVDARRGIEEMYQAYESYPGERTDAGTQRLIEACLAADNTAQARAIVMDLDAHVKAHPVDAPRLKRAALAWADRLYEKGDYRAAADAYALTIQADEGRTADTSWAQYQQANALVKLADFSNSATLYEQVVGSNTPWAEDAGLMAEYARLEQRLRGGSEATAGEQG